jgi:E3 ubiquitin-protein ligase TRIP12
LPFLFSLESRQRLLDCTGFGSSHALYRFQEHKVAAYRAKHAESMLKSQQQLARAREQQDIDAISRASDDLDIIEQRMYAKRIGAMTSDLARVARGNILENAIRLVDLHHASKHVLEVQFHEENGFGSGVTQNFYEAVSVALQLRSFNDEFKLWISDEHDQDCKLDPEGPFKYLINAQGLFPQPLPADASEAVVERVEAQFRFMGRLMGKAFRDKFTIPLPLHPHFFELVKGGNHTTHLDMLRTFSNGRDTLIPSEDWTPQHLLEAYSIIATELRDRSKGMDAASRATLYAEVSEREFMSTYLHRSYQCSLGEFLTATAASFVDPLTSTPLCVGGRERVLTVENLGEYVDLVASFWFVSGVRRQISAFCAGINDVFPFSALEVCSPRPSSFVPFLCRSARGACGGCCGCV